MGSPARLSLPGSTVEDTNSRNVVIRVVPRCGRAVFARRRISSGEVIERAPVIVIPKKQWPLVKKTTLEDYAFNWGKNGEQGVIALGYVSIYNHSYSPNAKLEELPKELKMEVTALRAIQSGEEITINYHGDPENQEPLWFDVVSSGRRQRRKKGTQA